MKKHITSNHKNIKRCASCKKQFDGDKALKSCMHNDHNHSGVNVNVSLNGNNDINIRLKQMDFDDGDLNVSIDEERMEALDKDVNPGDYN